MVWQEKWGERTAMSWVSGESLGMGHQVRVLGFTWESIQEREVVKQKQVY